MEESYFDGSILQLIGYSILAGLLTVVTLGIAYPWALCMLQRWETKHTVIGSKRLLFDGKGLQLLGLWIVLALIPFGVLIIALVLMRTALAINAGAVSALIVLCLMIIALCYGFFVWIKVKKWVVKHTHFEDGSVYAQPIPDFTSPPTPAPAYNPERNVRVSRSAEPGLLDKLVPVDSAREKILPFAAAVLTFAATLFILVSLFA